jgi:hypothetical protein
MIAKHSNKWQRFKRAPYKHVAFGPLQSAWPNSQCSREAQSEDMPTFRAGADADPPAAVLDLRLT